MVCDLETNGEVLQKCATTKTGIRDDEVEESGLVI